MSENIIIDGCNVVGCKYTNGLYNGVYGCINLSLNPACCKNPNCYFKQLQRAKAKLEQYKIKYPIIDCYRCKNFQENKVLKAENEKLKEKINLYNCSANCYKYKEVEKYRQALEEIRESCNAYAKTEDYVIDQTFNEFLENVFNKINEVLK